MPLRQQYLDVKKQFPCHLVVPLTWRGLDVDAEITP
jgi:hypothetical protein